MVKLQIPSTTGALLLLLLLNATALVHASKHLDTALGRVSHTNRRSHEVEKRAYSGTATWYIAETGNKGACGGWLSNSGWTVAVNSAQFQGGATCGQFVTITARGKTQTAVVADECTGCPWGLLDMTPSLFSAFDSQDEGTIQISWTFGAGQGGNDDNKGKEGQDGKDGKDNNGNGGGQGNQNNNQNNNQNHEKPTSTSTWSPTPTWKPEPIPTSTKQSTPSWTAKEDPSTSSSSKDTSSGSASTPPSSSSSSGSSDLESATTSHGSFAASNGNSANTTSPISTGSSATSSAAGAYNKAGASNGTDTMAPQGAFEGLSGVVLQIAGLVVQAAHAKA